MSSGWHSAFGPQTSTVGQFPLLAEQLGGSGDCFDGVSLAAALEADEALVAD